MGLARSKAKFPERVIQVGEGRFMRGFADWFIDQMNQHGIFEGRVVIAAPRTSGAKNIRTLNEQDGLYTVWLQGQFGGELVNQREVVESVSRGIDPYEDWAAFLACAENPDIQMMLSNVTEAGLVYQDEAYRPGEYQTSFAAKVTAYLYHRYLTLHGSADAGMHIIPCELLEDNGDLLRDMVLRHAEAWGLPTAFVGWVQGACAFCNTLVDRIVTGFPTGTPESDLWRDLGYEDKMLTVAEPFYLWAIQGTDWLRKTWPIEGMGFSVHLVDDVKPYRDRKVRILNGAHTTLCAPGLLADVAIVSQAMKDPVLRPFVQGAVYEEIIPALRETGQSDETYIAFANDVFDRFENPFIHHAVTALSLNHLSKFRIRLVPSIEAFVRLNHRVPTRLCASLAAALVMYRNDADRFTLNDDPALTAQVQGAWRAAAGDGAGAAVSRLLALTDVWGQDLNRIPGVADAVVEGIRGIEERGVIAYLQSLE